MHAFDEDARLRGLEEKYEGRDIPDAEWHQAQNVDDSKLINWQVVSDRMGGFKSRLQCSFKWESSRMRTEDAL